MNEEKYIEEKAGRRNPFQVPEGYFDRLADQVMASLPEREPVAAVPKARRVALRPLYYAAAAVCAFLISVVVWQSFPETTTTQPMPVQASVASQEVNDDDFEEAADYMMLDNYDIYACLTDN